MYLRDLSHSSFDAAETKVGPKFINSLDPLWTLSVQGKLAAGATLSGGVLYFGDWSGNFHAVDAKTGRELWQSFAGKAPDPSDLACTPGLGVSSQAAVIGNTVYVGGGDSAVYAFDKSTGEKLWRVPLADPATGAYLWSSIVPYQNSLFVGIASLDDCPLVRGALARIDLQTPQSPQITYLASPDNTGAGIWSTPAIDPASNTIFVTTGNGDSRDASTGDYSQGFLAMNASTLAVQSGFFLPEEEADDDLDWGSSPVLFTTPDQTQLAAATGKDGVLYAVRRSDMAPVWKTQIAVGCSDPEEGCGSLSTPAFDGKTLFVGAGVRDMDGSANGSLYAINPADGSVIWEHDTNGTIIAPVTVANGMVFAPTEQGLEIYDSATGQFLWSDGKHGLLYSQAVVSDGVVYCTYLKGEVVAWRLPDTSTQAAQNYSSAHGLPSFAPGSIASLYGTDLEGATVAVGGVPAEILYSSPTLINYVIPDSAPLGRVPVQVNQTAVATIQIALVAPGVFSANGDGKGPAAAQMLQIDSSNRVTVQPVYSCVSAGSCVNTPVDLESGGQTYLVLYGTGIRYHQTAVTCTIGGVAAEVTYAGPQGDVDGLDQVNVAIPKTLAGRGVVDVVLTVDRQLANTVTIEIN